MIQLKVYTIPGDNDTAIFLDLYDTEPIKLTLSIEDITRADATSVFSKTFRVPATRDNNEFFENAYAVDGIDFDVTLKKPAQILVDGSEFREGHVRLQKIYRNQDLDRIDYELLFLGETRDFSSVVAEKTLCQINMTDFTWNDSDGNPYVSYTNAADFVGPFDYNDIVTSWQAFPENPSLTAGTADGDILFPLIDHGNTYDNGDPEQGTIALGSTGNGVRSFTHSANSLGQDRLKPMIRAKRIWDQIFEDVDYTYTSNFLNSDRFHQMYISAFGNSEQVGMVIGQTTGTIFQSEEGSQGDNSFGGYMFNTDVTQNQTGSYNIGSSAVGSSFICPGASTPGGSYYLMNASASMRLEVEQSNGGNLQVSGRIELVVVTGGAGSSVDRVLAVGNLASNGSTSTLNWDSRNGNDVLAGERLQVNFTSVSSFVDYDIIQDTTWNCTAAPGDYYAPLDLDCEYKQIDFIKDILTMFRLVMQPDNARPNNFIIEPWQDFIGSGTTYDWSHKLAEQNDQVLEPLFNTQSATIEYSLAQDEDFINKFHFDNFKHAYGWLQFNSANELLKGTRKIEVKGLAPTPIDQIFDSTTNHPEPTFILPSIVEVTGEQTTSNPARPEQLSIKPKSRILFYNGKIPITVSQHEWYLDNDSGNAVLQTNYPLASSYEDWPVQQTSLNLNFANDTRYYITPSPGSGYFDQGSTLFDEYWSRYVASLYNKFSRRLTAKFILNNVDLQYLTFDDVIFVNGKYYRPEKIIDAQVGAETEVVVQLITLNDQRPIWLEEPLTGFSVAVSNTSCVGQAGEIQVTTNGTPAFAWELLQSGSTGNANPTGNAPFTFIVPAPVGIDTLLVTDSLGRTATIQVNVPASTATQVTSTNVHANPTDCVTPCNGSITVTASGGDGGPYTINWNDGGSGFARTGLCPATYEYYITDSNGCISDTFTQVLTCLTTPYVYQLREHLNNCTQSSSTIYIASSLQQLPVGQTLTLNERSGCYYIETTSTDTPQYTVDALSIDCAACIGGATNSWQTENCDVQGDFEYVSLTQTQLQPGDVVNNSSGDCYEVIQQSTNSVTMSYINVYSDCQDCGNSQSLNYLVQDCVISSGGVGSSTVPLAIGDVIKVGTNCAEVLAVSQGTPTFVIDASTIYDGCQDCAGITPPVQNCHTIENTGLGNATGTYSFNSLGYTFSLISGSLTAVCAEVGSVVITSGTATVTDSGDACTSPKQCRVPITLCNSYLITNDGGSLIGSYSFTECDGSSAGGLLNFGNSVTVCARFQPTVSAGLTISMGITTC